MLTIPNQNYLTFLDENNIHFSIVSLKVPEILICG